MTTFLSPRLTEALGWTLLHSLWQGAAFALLLGVMLVALRSYSAQARYAISVGLLAGFFLTAGTTLYVQWGAAGVGGCASCDLQIAGHAAPPPTAPPPTATPPTATPPTAPASAPAAHLATPTPFLTRLTDYYQRHLPLLVTLWLLGVLALQLRWLGQLAFVQRLRHYGTSALPETWVRRAATLEDKLRLRRAVTYRTSLRAATPMVVGWLRPVVLLPQAMLTQLTETELYAVLAHELAHVRRDDFAVNLAQTFLTNVFFFHPGVWWMSARVDDEREHCCDDLAVEATGDALPYARTLLNVSDIVQRGFRQNPSNAAPALAPAFTGKNSAHREDDGFGARVRRLFTSQAGVGTFREGFATALILTGALAVSVVATGKSGMGATGASAATIIKPSDTTRLDGPLDDVVGPDAPFGNVGDVDDPFGDAGEIADPFATGIAPTTVQSLVRACYVGDLAEVRRLVEAGADVNGALADGVYGDGYTPLIAAASGNEVAVAEYLISRGARVNQVASSWTALVEAADEGAYEVLELLLSEGAEVDYYAGPGSPTAVTMAAAEGHVRILERLQRAGGSLNGFGESRPPLHAAASEDQRHVTSFLIGESVNVNEVDERGRTALMYAAAEGHRRVAQLLLDAGADPELRDASGRLARDYAVAEDEYALAVLLGANANALPERDADDELWKRFGFDRDHDFGFPDFGFPDFGFPDLGDSTLTPERLRRIAAEARASVDTAEIRRSIEEAMRSVRMDSARIGVEVREALEQARLGVEHAFVTSEQARLAAEQSRLAAERSRLGAERSKAAARRLLDLDGGASDLKGVKTDSIRVRHWRIVGDADEVSSPPLSSLREAIVRGDAATVRRLLDEGADPDAVRPYGVSRATPDATGLTSWSYEAATPLLIAVHEGHLDIVRLLLAAGADAGRTYVKTEHFAGEPPSMVTRTDWTALHQAERQGNEAIAELLR